LVTAIAAEHLEKLHDLPTVAREERLILEHVARSGALLALNLDDPWLTEVPKKQNSARALGFSLDGAAVPQGVEGLQGHLSREGVLSLSGLGLDGFSLKVPMPGRHNARNLLGAVALARGLGLERDAIKTGLALFEGSGARSEIRRLGDGSVVLCDYYNASPASVAAGLDLAEDLFRQQAGRPVLWVCLGDMLELGREELEWHRGLSPRVIATSSTEVMCLGKRMASLAEELRTQGFKGQVRTYEGYEELARDLIRERRPGDVILIKGSRGMKMERVWQELNSDGAP
jgi:UDP-N-acetylmuramoyl-tripeptide--D-alanyl-D-alanine ligase